MAAPAGRISSTRISYRFVITVQSCHFTVKCAPGHCRAASPPKHAIADEYDEYFLFYNERDRDVRARPISWRFHAERRRRRRRRRRPHRSRGVSGTASDERQFRWEGFRNCNAVLNDRTIDLHHSVSKSLASVRALYI